MNGIVVIRAPDVMRVIHRAVLNFVMIAEDGTKLAWMHLGDSMLQGFEPDVLADDDDKTDYAEIARQMLDTIMSPRFSTRDVYWTWNAPEKKWLYEIAAMEATLPEVDSVDEDLVGFGSLGR